MSKCTTSFVMDKPPAYRRRTPADLTDQELKKKICCGIKGGCAQCTILKACQWGQEAKRRNLQ